MDPTHFDTIKTEIEAFAEYLDAQPTMSHALNHSAMEHWIAIEALKFFGGGGGKEDWVAWETIGLITRAPVRPNKNGSDHGIKFPDLVAVKNDLMVWFEFKAMSRRALHPKSAGGTLELDIKALAAFDKEKTQKYIADGKLPGIRENEDSRTIKASGLFGDDHPVPFGERAHIGVALLIWPREASLAVPVHGEVWNPTKKAGEIHGLVMNSDRKAANSEPPRWTPPKAMPNGGAMWRAWFVNMPG